MSFTSTRSAPRTSVAAFCGVTVAPLAFAALTLTIAASKPANAQNLYLTSGSYTASDATYQNGSINVGLDSSGTTFGPTPDYPYVATLYVVTNGNVQTANLFNTSTVNVSGGTVADIEGTTSSTTNISGGNVSGAFAYDSNITNVSGGTVANLQGNSGNSTVNVSGGTVSNATGNEYSTFNISGGSIGNVSNTNRSKFNLSGGTVGYAYASGLSTAFGSSKSGSMFNISGGTLTNGLELQTATETINFIGTGLTSTYNGYGNNNPYNSYADFFTISGTFGGAARSYDLYIDNPNGASGTPNSAARQFAFSAPTGSAGAPEPGSIVLLLTGVLPLAGFVARRRAARA